MKFRLSIIGTAALLALTPLALRVPAAQAQSGATAVYPNVPKQVLMTFEFVTATPAMRAAAAQETKGALKDTRYEAALLRAGAKVTDAEKITTTDTVKASVQMATILPPGEKLPAEYAPGENFTATPTINKDGTITVD